jgi:MFS family permease
MAQSVSVCGDLLAAFAVQSALVFRLHATAREASGVFLVALLPTVVLGPLAGVLADRWDPRRIMISSDIARACLILLLAFTSNLREIYAISFAIGCVSSLFLPAQAIALPLAVGSEGFLAASTLLQQTMQLLRIATPALAGALVAVLGERACYVADSASFLCSAIFLRALFYKPRRNLTPRRGVVRDLRAGLRFLFTQPQLCFVTSALFAGVFAAGCFSALVPLYIRDILGADALLLGSFGSLIALGALAGTVGMQRLARRHAPERLMGLGMAIMGGAILLFTILPNLRATIPGALAMGLGVAVAMMASSLALQGQTPLEMRGRLSAASAALTSLAQLLAYVAAGSAAGWLGVRGVFAGSAMLLLSIALTAALRAPRGGVRCSLSPCAANNRSAPSGS